MANQGAGFIEVQFSEKFWDFVAGLLLCARSNHMSGRVIVIAAAITVLFQIGCIKPSQQKRVIISLPKQWPTPEKWPAKDQRDCVLESDDPVSKLPRLNCDLPASDTPTPRSRMAVMEVKFSTTPERQLYVEWVCKPAKDSLVCWN